MRNRDASRVRVQVQLDGAGEHAVAVERWLHDCFPHLEARCDPTPGLLVAMTVPQEPSEGAWHERLSGFTLPIDVMLEILCACLEDLRVPEASPTGIAVTEGPWLRVADPVALVG